MPTPSARLDHAFMGALFGLLHLAYGVYLYVTEPRESLRVNPEPFLQLDRVIHEKGRLAIMSMLAASPELSFTELRDTLEMTDGNLTTHSARCRRRATSRWRRAISATGGSRRCR